MKCLCQDTHLIHQTHAEPLRIWDFYSSLLKIWVWCCLLVKTEVLKLQELKWANNNNNNNKKTDNGATGWWILFKLLPLVWAAFEQSLPVALNLPGTVLGVHRVVARSAHSGKIILHLDHQLEQENLSSNIKAWHGNNGRDQPSMPGRDLSAWHTGCWAFLTRGHVTYCASWPLKLEVERDSQLNVLLDAVCLEALVHIDTLGQDS